MKRIFISMMAAGAAWTTCLAADTTFEMNFDGQTLKPGKAAGDRSMGKAISVKKDANFVPGYNGKPAFVLSDANAEKKESIMFSAVKNVSFDKGSFSFWFKPIKTIEGKKSRFFHIYSPGAGNKGLIAYYFYCEPDGTYVSSIYVKDDAGDERAVVRIPAGDLSADKFQKIDVTYDDKLLSVYLNGELIEDADMPANFAGESVKPRDWSSFMVLPVILSDGDDWASRIALDDVKIYNQALSADDVSKNYQQDVATMPASAE